VSVAFTAADAAAWTGGALRAGAPQTRFAAVSIDTRTCPPGALFVAIRGPRHDAHAFLDRALAAGAGGLVVEAGCGEALADGPVRIEVEDTTRALGALAAGHRAGFDGPVVGITGSNGKTTTKEMCSAILEGRGPCLHTRGNLNNLYGLPLTLLSREPEHRFAVVELGMNRRGEIAALAAIARPDVGVLTNIGTAHIGNLGSQEAIAAEKGDLLAALAPHAVAVVNADDRRVLAQAERTSARVLRFGRSLQAEVRAEDVAPRGEDYAFRLVAPAGEVSVEVPGLGETTVANALAAAAGALAAGASLEDVRRGLAAYRPAAGRMQRRAGAGGTWILDDSYNANPQSLEAALAALARLGARGRALAVLGDMGELGERAAEAHRAAGALAARLELDGLFAVGEHAAQVAEGAAAAGMRSGRIQTFADAEETARALRERLSPGDWILVKGSRSMRMERVVEALRAPEPPGAVEEAS